eukprot:XP_028343915.1 uncharacterized protein LOC114486025 [Physeter catodon]
MSRDQLLDYMISQQKEREGKTYFESSQSYNASGTEEESAGDLMKNNLQDHGSPAVSVSGNISVEQVTAFLGPIFSRLLETYTQELSEFCCCLLWDQRRDQVQSVAAYEATRDIVLATAEREALSSYAGLLEAIRCRNKPPGIAMSAMKSELYKGVQAIRHTMRAAGLEERRAHQESYQTIVARFQIWTKQQSDEIAKQADADAEEEIRLLGEAHTAERCACERTLAAAKTEALRTKAAQHTAMADRIEDNVPEQREKFQEATELERKDRESLALELECKYDELAAQRMDAMRRRQYAVEEWTRVANEKKKEYVMHVLYATVSATRMLIEQSLQQHVQIRLMRETTEPEYAKAFANFGRLLMVRNDKGPH